MIESLEDLLENMMRVIARAGIDASEIFRCEDDKRIAESPEGPGGEAPLGG